MPTITDPTTIQELRSNGVDVYDFSSYGTCIACPRKYQHRHEQGLVLAVEPEPSHSLMFGAAIHKALEFWYPKKQDDKALLVFAQEFKPYEEQPTLSPKTGKELDATYTVRFGCALLDAYFTRYRNEHFELIQNEIPVAEELSENIFVAGRIDKILSLNGKLLFRDHKTSKYMDKFLLNPNPQFMGYKFLCEKLTGERVKGELDMLGVAKSKDVSTLLRREVVDYSPHQMNEWKKSVVHVIGQIRSYRREGYFPQYWNCRAFFKDCAYLPICTLAREEERASLIANLYKVDYWDPFTID